MDAGDFPTQTKPASGRLAATMLKSMRRIAQAIDVRSRQIARTAGLTLPQLLVMQAIRGLGQVTTQAVSAEAAMSPATVVAVIDKLEARGLVERYRSKVDRRVVHTRLTPAGETALDEAPPLLPGFEQAFRALPQADQATLAQALETVATLMADGRRRAQDEAGEMVDATGIEPVTPSV